MVCAARSGGLGGRCRQFVASAAILAVQAPADALSAPTVAELIETAEIASLAVAPDGRKIAFRVERADIQRNGYRLDWYVGDMVTGRVTRVGGGGDPIFSGAGPLEREAPIWSADGRFIHYRALADGAIGVWRAAADGSVSEPVVVEAGDVERIEAADGTGLFYLVGPARDEIERAERREHDEGVLIDAGVDISQPLFRGGSVNGRRASQRLTGRWYARAGLLWRQPRTRKRLDLATLASSFDRTIAPAEQQPLATVSLDQSAIKVSAGGHVATLQLAGGKTILEVKRRDAGETLRCQARLCTEGRIDFFAWRQGTEEILFTARDGHFRQTLALWDTGTGRVRRIAGGEGLLAGSDDWSEPCALTRTAALCVSAAATAPPRLERIDLVSGRRSLLFDPNLAIRQHGMPQVEHLAWTLADGRTATATLLKPRGTPRRAPLFISYYVCPGFLKGGEGEDYPLAPLADAGFVVACMNMVPFEDVRDGLGRYRDSLAAVASLVDMLSMRGLVDPAKVGMGGFSAGSEATAWVLMNSGLLAAAGLASAQYAPSNYWLHAMRGSSIPTTLRHFHQLGSPEETPERWRLLSPALNVARIRAPVLMQLPEQEVRHQMEFYARLSHTRTPVELHAFPEEAHIKMQPRHRFAVGRRNVHWFRYWLQGHADPDPTRADQYRRWEDLRRRQAASAGE